MSIPDEQAAAIDENLFLRPKAEGDWEPLSHRELKANLCGLAWDYGAALRRIEQLEGALVAMDAANEGNNEAARKVLDRLDVWPAPRSGPLGAVTVRDLMAHLRNFRPNLPVAYALHSEYKLLELNEIEPMRLQPPRADGWIHDNFYNRDSALRTTDYLVFPGN